MNIKETSNIIAGVIGGAAALTIGILASQNRSLRNRLDNPSATEWSKMGKKLNQKKHKTSKKREGK